MPLTTRGSASARRRRRDPYIQRAKKRMAVVVIVIPYRSAAFRRSTSERANFEPIRVGGVQKRPEVGQNGLPLKSEAISHDIEALERDLASMRARVEDDSSSFAALEQQVAELRENLLKTRESVTEREARLAEKHKELAETKRLEALAAYEDDLRSQREAADRAADAATDLLAALDPS